MNFKTIEDIKAAGFCGFIEIGELKKDKCQSVPDTGSVYTIVKADSAAPVFLPKGTGGFFKGENPNVSVSELQENWVKGTCVVYIGKANCLKTRLRQYMRFGCGKNVGHKGGRYIWQLSDADKLLVAWKETADMKPRDNEKMLIQEFKNQYKARPFANLQD